jgi:ectoine hydroxylase-related dioxygenase (phytanoyl-CoA dioxygenase family)
MITIDNIKDLETKGYAVIKNFLSIEEKEKLQSMYKIQRELAVDKKDPAHQGVSGNMKIIQMANLNMFKEKSEEVMKLVREHTDIVVDCFPSYGAVFDNTLIVNEWHTDNEPYYLFQNSYNILTFWIPFIKTERETSNMIFLPHDKLPKDIANRIKTIGAQILNVNPENNTTLYRELDSGFEEVWNFNVEDLAVTVEVDEGDCILFRDDTIHRTQDKLSHRVALAYRCRNSHAMINKEKLFKYSEDKYKKASFDSTSLNKFFSVCNTLFEEKQTSDLCLTEIVEYLKTQYKTS